MSATMARGVKDITGHRFGRAVVQEFAGTEGRRAWWWCKCDCVALLRGRPLRARRAPTWDQFADRERAIDTNEDLPDGAAPFYNDEYV
jgi:hypothetical protein